MEFKDKKIQSEYDDLCEQERELESQLKTIQDRIRAIESFEETE